jgi:hypothetical protein
MARLKPPVAARPSALLRTRRAEVLAPRAEEHLFGVAEVLAEGRAEGATYFGTTLVTFDLARLGVEHPAERLLPTIEGSLRVRLRIARLALEDVARKHPDAHFGTATLETRFRASGRCLFADVEVEVPLLAPARREHG